MIQKPMDVLTTHPVRKTKKQKEAFRSDAQAYLQTLGYESKVEKGSFGARNLVFGNQQGAKYLVTAHYDTCARLPFPNFITPCDLMPYLLYQIAIVVGFFAVAFVVEFGVIYITRDAFVGSIVGYSTFLALLMLLLFGPANKHNANDNTSGVVTVLEIAAAIPQEKRSKVCFVLFDLEEAGLIGSASYRKQHKKATEDQIVLNLDCVGDGDEIMMFPTKRLKKDVSKMLALRSVNAAFGDKKLTLYEKGFSMYPSDQSNFPYGVGIAALRRGKRVGLYCSRIHTNKDTTLEEENVYILRDRLISLVAGSEEIA